MLEVMVKTKFFKNVKCSTLVQAEEMMDAVVGARKYAFENLQSAPMFENRTVPSDGFYHHNA